MAKMIPVHYKAAEAVTPACKPRNVYTVFSTSDPAKVTCKRCLRMLETGRRPAARAFVVDCKATEGGR